ncbi:MAG TPA: inositol monophosphatase family protein [Candidatus Saccharimonadales bacterium]|nr:inositol monophosphatase family protein [Candidatus Saccharimonadales bacterium]
MTTRGEALQDWSQLRPQVEQVASRVPITVGRAALRRRGVANPHTREDAAAHRFLQKQLPRIVEAPILSEEDGRFARFMARFRRRRQERQDADGWVIDPIDGSINHTVGYGRFATSIAYVSGGESVFGAVRWHTRGRTFSAVRGQGAFVNGEPLAVANEGTVPNRPKIAYGIANRPKEGDAERVPTALQNIWRNGWETSQGGSAAIDICAVAQGDMAAFFEFGLSRWDFAAAGLIAEEAGCVVLATPAAVNPKNDPHLFDFIVARDQELLDKIAELTGMQDGDGWV